MVILGKRTEIIFLLWLNLIIFEAGETEMFLRIEKYIQNLSEI